MNSRDRILDVAAESFLNEGYRSTRMTQIAHKANLSRAMLYKYFDTKEAVLLALNSKVIDDARNQGLDLLLAEGPAGKRIGNWLRDSLHSQWRHHAVRVVTIEETQGILMANANATICIVDEVKQALTKAIKQGVLSGEFRSSLKAPDAAYTLQALLLGLHRNNVSSRPLFEVRDKKHIDTAIELILGGLRS